MWGSMVCEVSAELVSAGEDYRQLGRPLGHNRWPFYRELPEARAGRPCVFCLRVGGPSGVRGGGPAVAMFIGELFDAVFTGW
ncbi:MAG TPA: hypothetical protein VGQ26_07290 [Streptosporangiaceae bacterium]|nr:hypothetical protein [Streptosporangiaceae bacterium]